MLNIFITFIFLSSSHCPPPSLLSYSSSSQSSSPLSPRGCPHPARPLHSLRPQISQGLGVSSPTDARPGSLRLSMCLSVNLKGPDFSPVVGYKYLCLSQSAACWTSQRTAMLLFVLHLLKILCLVPVPRSGELFILKLSIICIFNILTLCQMSKW